MADKIKLGLAVVLVVAGIFGYYYLSEHALVLRVLAVMGGLVLAAAVAWTTAPGKQFFAFSQDSWSETRKVVWPTRKETFQTTAVVFAMVVVMALFLWAVDASLMWMVKLLMGRGE